MKKHLISLFDIVDYDVNYIKSLNLNRFSAHCGFETQVYLFRVPNTLINLTAIGIIWVKNLKLSPRSPETYENLDQGNIYIQRY